MNEEWKLYKLQEFDDNGNARTNLCVIEAPSPGVAVEVFLAEHGMLCYIRVKLEVVKDKDVGESFTSRKDVCELFGNSFDLYESMQELDIHHVWEEW